MSVRVGVIGAGRIGREHIERLTDVIVGAEVVTVTDVDKARAEEVAESVGARISVTGTDLIGESDVDAVLVTSPGQAHAEYVLAAIAAGKPVFCEKPLAAEVEDCRRIVEAEIAHGKRLVQVGFMRRYDRGYRELKQVLDAGDIGTPLIVHCVHRNASVPGSYHSAMAAQDTAVHEIDAVRWLLKDEIVSVQVLSTRLTSKRSEHLRDPQIMLFATAAGIRIDLEVFVNCQYGYDIQCEVVGENGLARLPDPARVVVRTGGSTRSGVPQDWRERFDAAFEAELREWVGAIAVGECSGPSAWDGYAATVVTDATVEAMNSGRIVSVDIPDRPAFYAYGR